MNHLRCAPVSHKNRPREAMVTLSCRYLSRRFNRDGSSWGTNVTHKNRPFGTPASRRRWRPPPGVIAALNQRHGPPWAAAPTAYFKVFYLNATALSPNPPGPMRSSAPTGGLLQTTDTSLPSSPHLKYFLRGFAPQKIPLAVQVSSPQTGRAARQQEILTRIPQNSSKYFRTHPLGRKRCDGSHREPSHLFRQP